MPGAILPNTGVQLPAAGSDPGDWDDINNAAWGNYDVHDHSPGSGVQIPTVGIDIDAILSLNGYGLEDIGTLAFDAIPALATGALTLFVNDADDELYWRTGSGVNVRLTLNGTIDASLIGGIGGDYTTVGAELAYDDSDERFTFKDGDGNWAHLAGGDLHLYEHGTTETVRVAIKVPSALAAPYDVTLPDAVPAAVSLLRMNASGALAPSGTIDESITFAAGRSITLAGDGKYCHAGRSVYCQALSQVSSTASGGPVAQTGGVPRVEVPVSTEVFIPVLASLENYAQVTSIAINTSNNISATVTASLWSAGTDMSGGGAFVDQSTSTVGGGIGVSQMTLTPASPLLMESTGALWVKIETTAAASCDIYNFIVNYKVEP